MRILLSKIKIHNFKGIRSFECYFKEDITMIDGDNGTGKTTIEDAFNWCLFGKDSKGNKEFEVKTLDANNQPYPRLEHAVEVELMVDGLKMNLKRVFIEKWTKKRGSDETVFDGHVTKFFWDDVPLNASEYKQKVQSACDEDLFKVLTSVWSFNSIHWKERRKVLVEMSGDISNQDVIDSNDEFNGILDSLGGKTIEEEKKRISAKKKQLKEELKQFPPRIDEVERQKPAPVDEKSINEQLESLRKTLSDIEQKEIDDSKSNQAVIDKKKQLQDELFVLESDLKNEKNKFENHKTQKRHEANSGRDKISREVDEARSNYDSKLRIASNLQKDHDDIGSKINKMRGEYDTVFAEEFVMDESKKICPTCKRPHDNAEELESEMIQNFNTNKHSRLEEINKRGRSLKEQMESISGELQRAVKEKNEASYVLTNKTEELNNYKTEELVFDEPESFKIGAEKIQSKKNEIESMSYVRQDFSRQKSDINNEISHFNSMLQSNKRIEESNKRIEELKSQEKSMAVELSQLESFEFLCEKFTRKKIEMIEKSVNNMFKIVKFKMFKHLINGGFEETCEAMVNGVPFSSLNHASKINSGVDIINSLSVHYGTSAPIFVDNAEAVNELVSTESQLITLSVSKSKQLNIN